MMNKEITIVVGGGGGGGSSGDDRRAGTRLAETELENKNKN